MANALIDPLVAAAAADVPAIGASAAPLGDSAGVNPFAGKLVDSPSGDAGPGTPPPPPVPTIQPVVAPTVPAPAPPAPPQQAVPNPFAGKVLPQDNPTQGTASPPATQATAAGSIDSVAGIGTPATAPSASGDVNPFAGKQFLDAPVQGGSAASRAMAAANAGNPPGYDPQNPDTWSDLERQVINLPPKGSAADVQHKAKVIGLETYQAVKDGLLGTVGDMANAAQLMWRNPGIAQGNMAIMPPDEWLTLPPDQAEEKMKSAVRGGAMIATSALPGVGEFIPTVGTSAFFTKTLTGKVLALVANGEAAGAAYGTVAPKEEGQTRWDTITSNTLAFGLQVPVFHGVFKVVGWPVGKVLDKTGISSKIAGALDRYNKVHGPPIPNDPALIEAAQHVQDILDNVRANGADPKNIPHAIKEDLVALSIDNATHPPDPNIVDLDAKTIAINKELDNAQTPRDVNLDVAGQPITRDLGLQGPRDVQVPDRGPGPGQTRIAQGVYQNPDGSVEAYGYRGVGEQSPHSIDTRGPLDPGLMGSNFISPHPEFAQEFGELHYMGAKFKNPLIMDNWHDKLSPDIEKLNEHFFKNEVRQGQVGNDPSHTGAFHGDQNIDFYGDRQPGVIWAARQLGHDGIIVRHGEQSVEVVSLHPSTLFHAGAAEHVAVTSPENSSYIKDWKLTPNSDVQRMVADRAKLEQSFHGGAPVKDLGQTNINLDERIAPVPEYASHLKHMQDRETATRSETFPAVQRIIESHVAQIPDNVAAIHERNSMRPGESHNDYVDRLRDSTKEGLYRINGRVFKSEFVDNGRGDGGVKYRKMQVTEVTGQVGVDPTVHPAIAQTSLLHDAVSKASVDIDLVQQLGPTNEAAAKQLAGYEPTPRGFTGETLKDKMANKGRRAMDAAGHGLIDQALIDMTAPREIADWDRPELSNPGNVRTKLPPGLMNRELSRMEEGRPPLPPGHKWITTEALMKANLRGEAAMDGRIFAETVDEHIRNAQQMLSFEDRPEAAKRLRWAFEKNPVEAAKLMDTDSRLVKLNDSPEMEAQRKLAKVKLQPWEVDVLRKYNNMMDMSRSMAPGNIERTQSFITEVLENARAREAGAPPLGEDQVGMVHVSPATQERAPWSPVPAGVAVPQIPTDWAMLARTEESLRQGIIDKVELPGVQKPAETAGPVKRSSLTGRPITSNKVGIIDAKLIFRIASGGTSGLLNIAAANTDDPATRKWLFMAGGVTAALALMPEKNGWFEKTAFSKALMRMNDLPALMKSEVGIPAADKLRDATDIANYFVGTAKLRALELNKAFPSVAERELLARAIDDPNNAAVWGKLSHDQQQLAGREGIINHQLGQMLKARGIIDQYRDNYIAHIFPKETYNAWRTAKGSLSGGGFTKPRVFNTLTDAENWANANNLPGPILDGPQLQAKHLLEVGRAVMGDQITKDMKNMGLLIDRNAGNVPPGWVTPRVGGMHDLIAPQPVALALERLGNYRPGILDSQFLKALDTIKGFQMRMVMAFPWIHGVNVARAALALDGTGIAYSRAMNALQAADPSVARALKHGVMLFDRPDYSPKHAEGFQAMLEKVGSALPDAVNNATFTAASNFLKSGETALWDKWVPSLGLGSFNIEMHNWTERTGGRFAEGTPEFRAAARTAADNANTKMGKSLQLLKDPGLVYMMRNIFFAPQWMGSRIRITMASLGEFRGVATGQIPLADVKMLPDKIRSLLIGATFTYVASKLWSGNAPQFNPNNSKFYIRTGVYDQNKREVGVDVAGWYADDIKLFSDPTKYFMNRLSPMIQATHTAISGRDAFGRSIGGLELADQTINEFGPAGSMVDAAARTVLAGGVTGADAIKGALTTSDIGSSASLPRPGDLKLQAMAYKTLQKYGLPTDDDHIYALQQMIGSNIRRGKTPLDDAVMTYLAFQKRSYERQLPKSAATRWLWRQTQQGLRDLAK